MDIIRIMLIVFGVTLVILSASGSGYEFDPDYLIPPKCKPCDATPCPQLTYCVGKVLKDHCGCCLRCSSDLFQPNYTDPSSAKIEAIDKVAQTKVDVCQQRGCPKFKICLINQQGLPICTCPSPKVCNKRGKRANQLIETSICGSNGVTYSTKCHLRLANCNSIRRIKKSHMGPCMKDKFNVDAGGSKDDNDVGMGGYSPGYISKKPLSKKEENARLKALKRAQRRKMKKRLKKRRLRKKGKKEKKEKGRNRRRSKRLNSVFNPYSSHYDFLLRKHTNWSHNQIRKSRI